MNDAFTVIIGPTIKPMKTTIILNYSNTHKLLSLNYFLFL